MGESTLVVHQEERGLEYDPEPQKEQEDALSAEKVPAGQSKHLVAFGPE